MDSKHVIGLYEAYLDVYEDQLNEANRSDAGLTDDEKRTARINRGSGDYASHYLNRGDKKQKGKKPLRPHGKYEIQQHEKRQAQRERDSNEQRRRDSQHSWEPHSWGNRNEEVDLYDVVLDHLLEEGYCDDVESAEVIMANMSEEWVDEIVEGYKPLPVGKMIRKATKLGSKAAQATELANTLSKVPRGLRTITGTKGLPEKLKNKRKEFLTRAATISVVADTHDPERFKRRDSLVAQRNHVKAQLDQASPKSNIRPFARKMNEDLYYAVLDYLLDEGYCDDVNSAEMIMTNMSEEWVDEILDEANKGDDYVTSSMYMSREPETKEAKIRRRQSRDLPNLSRLARDASSGEREELRQWAHRHRRGMKKPEAKSRPTGSGKYGAMQRRK